MTLKNLMLLLDPDQTVRVKYAGAKPCELTPGMLARLEDKIVRRIEPASLEELIVELEDDQYMIKTSLTNCHI